MANVTATVGAEFLSGNSLYPHTDRVVGIVTWTQLTEKERRSVRTIEYWMPEETLDSREYVRYSTTGRKGTGVTARRTFEATRYETHKAMVDAYAR